MQREPTDQGKLSQGNEEFISGLPASFRDVADDIVKSFYGDTQNPLQFTKDSGFKVEIEPSSEALAIAVFKPSQAYEDQLGFKQLTQH